MKHGLKALLLLTSLASALFIPSQAVAATDSKGTDFWIMFTNNYASTPELTLFITGDISTTGVVAIPGLGFSQNFSVIAGTVTSVPIPPGAQVMTSDTVENLGIHVTAADEVTVYGLNRIQYTTDAFLGLPTDILGTEYLDLGYSTTIPGYATEFGIVATADATTVTITPTVATGSYSAGTPYTVSLNQGQTYQLQNPAQSADLTGTVISSDKPIAVYGGNVCTDIPLGYVACDYVVEEMTPTSTWGKDFVTMPLATRTAGDTFRFLASTDGTTVTINGSQVATLNRGQYWEQIVTGPAQITSNQPILVAQYSNSSSFDGVTSDPFEMLIPPYEQFLASYTVTTPATGFTANFINVVAPTSEVGSITLDGTAIPAANFVAIGTTAFSGAQVPVALGSHALAGSLPFGAFVYGFADYDSYGYPGGMSLAPVAQVTAVALTPKTASLTVDTQACVTGTVTDQNNNPLAGVRLDFAVTGVNPTSGFGDTNTSGQVQFCYTGTNSGADTITGSVGTISDTATVNWLATGGKCPLSQGYWKNTPRAWMASSVSLGSQTYTQSQLLFILGTPVGGTADASLILADQLIAAKLNIANGSNPTTVLSTITDADALLSGFGGSLPYHVKPSSVTGQRMTADAAVLSSYNNRVLTPVCQP